MANQEHLDILAKGVAAWNAWRERNPALRPDLCDAKLRDMNLGGAALSGAALRSANLMGANLSEANLSGANLSNADLGGANLVRANLTDSNLSGTDLSSTALSGADLSGVDLGGADLSGANLNGANLAFARLHRANLSGADLSGADFRVAFVGHTVFGDVDLSEAIGLDTVRHLGPSSIGLDSIYRSKGQIPESFLRGAGVSEDFVTFIKTLSGAAFDFYSCFISYSTRDQGFADRLYADLQASGVRCWFAPHDIQGGRKVHEQIDEAIKVYDKLLLILSDASMNSAWVRTEIANARAKEVHQGRQMLFPIAVVPFERIRTWKLFDADTGIDSAREVREYFVPDFSDWKDHDTYSRAFERLVRDLKAGPSDKPAGQPAT
jgi:uncharacterized protein YjbI with pentapeptide repeats